METTCEECKGDETEREKLMKPKQARQVLDYEVRDKTKDTRRKEIRWILTGNRSSLQHTRHEKKSWDKMRY